MWIFWSYSVCFCIFYTWWFWVYMSRHLNIGFFGKWMYTAKSIKNPYDDNTFYELFTLSFFEGLFNLISGTLRVWSCLQLCFLIYLISIAERDYNWDFLREALGSTNWGYNIIMLSYLHWPISQQICRLQWKRWNDPYEAWNTTEHMWTAVLLCFAPSI